MFLSFRKFGKVFLGLLIIILSYCCKPPQQQNISKPALLYVASQRPNSFTVSGNVYYSGIIKNAILEVRSLGKDGGCAPDNKGELIKSLTINDKGAIEPPTTLSGIGIGCYLVLPNNNSTFIDENPFLSDSQKEKPWKATANYTPYLSAVSADNSNFIITPLTRFAAVRFSQLVKSGVDATTALNRANTEVASIFFPDDSRIKNIVQNDLNFSSPLKSELTYLLVLKALDLYASNTASTFVNGYGSGTVDDFEKLWSLYSSDLSDGNANGAFFNGSAILSFSETGSNGKKVSINSPSIDLTPYISILLAKEPITFSSIAASTIRFCSSTDSTGKCMSSACLYSGGTEDPFYQYQWHLNNTGQYGSTIGEDIHLGSTWSTNRGEGVIVGVVDDGASITHEDLKENIVGGFNFADNGKAKDNPESDDAAHGTCVSGVIAAKALNGLGVRGAAPCANIFASNLLLNYTAETEALAMSSHKSIWVSNNSWGATDATGQIAAAATTWKDAVTDSLVNARGGKGTIFVWASGNGSFSNKEVDNSNYDGQANYYGVVTVSAIGNNGVRASYSDNGANVWITTYSLGRNGGNTEVGITTTDLPENLGFNPYNYSDYDNTSYTNSFSGTSAAAPLAVGGIALLLKENPLLTWRDVKLILAKSAKKNDPTDSDWATNSAGYNINHKYGFGSMDVQAGITLAKTWTSVGGSESLKVYPSAGYSSNSPNLSIPDANNTGTSDTITIANSSISKIEYVEIQVKTSHKNPGDLKIELQNGYGTKSVLALQHTCYSSPNSGRITCPDYDNWVFGSGRHLEESPNTTWKLTVIDSASGNTGTLASWGLKFYGR